MQRFARFMAATMVVGLMAAILPGGCAGIPKDTVRQAQVGKVRITAAGAGIVSSNDKSTVIRIRCDDCGFVSEELTIDTPAPGAAFTMTWVCPQCGHKQKITVTAAFATPPPAGIKP
jgi:predicted RNA-binding Zn-ribbon protein involved in translation (DUF1610 family)